MANEYLSASELIYGAAASPRMVDTEWFSSTMITMCPTAARAVAAGREPGELGRRLVAAAPDEDTTPGSAAEHPAANRVAAMPTATVPRRIPRLRCMCRY
ncbi:hypothetical protein GCM10009596_10220 [Arthrobacter rhombi]